MEAFALVDIRRNLLVAVQAQIRLPCFAEAGVTL
jgi:hypothetical protein